MSFEYLPALVEDSCDLINQKLPELVMLDDIVSWKQTPTFLRSGRTAWVPTTEINVATTPLKVKSVKLKGAGYLDEKGVVHQPTTQPYCRMNPHFGIAKDGSFIPVMSQPVPVGGITLASAKQEYEIAKILLEKGVPTVIPIKVYLYQPTHLNFITGDKDRGRLGAVAMGLLDDNHFRTDVLLDFGNLSKASEVYFDKLREELGIPNSTDSVYMMLSRIAFLTGQTLRRFSEAGFYRYSVCLDNLGYSTQDQSVYLIDLDSSLYLQNCSSVAQPLQVTRDATSFLFNLCVYLTKPGYINNFMPTKFEEVNPFRSFLQGYFHEIDSHQLNLAGTMVYNRFLTIYQESGKYLQDFITENRDKIDHPSSFTEWLNFGNFRESWLNRDEAFAFIMAVVWKLFLGSQLRLTYPSTIDEETFFANVGAFCSHSFSVSLSETIKYNFGR